MDAKVTCENITNQSQIMMSQMKGKGAMQQPLQPPFASPASTSNDVSESVINQKGGRENG